MALTLINPQQVLIQPTIFSFVLKMKLTGPNFENLFLIVFKSPASSAFKGPALNNLRSLYLQHLAYHLDAVLFE